MPANFQYPVLEILHESEATRVCRSRDDQDRPVILKCSRCPDSARDVEDYYREYSITRSLQRLPGVIAAYGLDDHRGSLTMVLEDFAAVSLDKLLSQRHLPLEMVLNLAMAMTEALGTLHRAGVIHKNINPSNLVVNPTTGQLKIIDFGIAVNLGDQWGQPRAGVVDGTLPYLSPEQTGRLDRPIDHRTDFYALGASLYELLAHQPPFCTSDPLELVHCHLAQQPAPICERIPMVPRGLSDIIMKLLAKNAEERYGSAQSITADLIRCRGLLKIGKKQFYFQPGRDDHPTTLAIPAKLYGRNDEIALFRQIYSQVAGGQRRLLLISGPAGIGKTLLAEEMERVVREQGGLFVGGSYQRLNQQVPYSGIIQALKQLALRLLSEDQPSLDRWRCQIASVLGDQGREIVEMIPEFAPVIGPKSLITGLTLEEDRNRFYLMFENFISVFAQAVRPLVLFLDDLQWADHASLALTQHLIASPISGALLIAGAFRDDEPGTANPVFRELPASEEVRDRVDTIALAPLTKAVFNEFFAGCLNCSARGAMPLATWVHTRAMGNPLHAKAIISSLHDQKILQFDLSRQAWQWSMADVAGACLPDSVSDLLAEKFRCLCGSTRKNLAYGAYIGSVFAIATLAKLVDEPVATVTAALQKAVDAGLLVMPAPTSFENGGDPHRDPVVTCRFAHDRIHAAAYDCIAAPQRPALHQQIGELLLQGLTDDQVEEAIFEIVGHLNHAIPGLDRASDRVRLATFNLSAGNKARRRLAFDPAYRYFSTGIDLLEGGHQPRPTPPSVLAAPWKAHYALMLALYTGALEAAYLTARFDQVDRLSALLLSRAEVLLDKIRVYQIKVQACHARNQIKEAIAVALHALSLLGIEIPAAPGRRHIVMEYIKTRALLKNRPPESLAALPAATDPQHVAALNILRSTLLPANYVDTNLFPILILKGIRISVKHGQTGDSAFAYAGYGVLLCGILGKPEAGYQYGCLATQMLERFQAVEFGAKILTTVSIFTTHWRQHLRETLAPLLRAYEAGLKTGDFEFAAVAIRNHAFFQFLTGVNLAEVDQQSVISRQALLRLKQYTALNYHHCLMQAVSNLIKTRRHPQRLIGAHYNENIQVPLLQKAADARGLFYFYLLKAMLGCLFERREPALESILQAQGFLSNIAGTTAMVQFHFYSALIHLSVLAGAGQPLRRQYLKSVTASLKRLRQSALSAPVNYENKYRLVQAEYYRFNRQEGLALDHYGKAIAASEKNGYLHEAALAHEFAGRFHFARGETDPAEQHLRQAWQIYHRWGAAAKTAAMEKAHPAVFKNGAHDATGEAGGRDACDSLDLASVVKASAAIHGEIHLDRLIDQLMQILLQNSGALRMVLFIVRDGQLAALEFNPAADGHGSGLASTPLEACEHVPRSLIQYVQRVGQWVSLDGSAPDPLFAGDPYLKTRQPRSVLCFPLQHKARSVGIIYLENYLTAGAFTPQRLKVLEILAAQIAISLENSRLYHDLENQAAETKAANLKLQQEIARRYLVETELRTLRDHLKQKVKDQALELRQSKKALAGAEQQSVFRQRYRNLVGKSECMQAIYTLIDELADVGANVLITGESGTGKELVAEALHYKSQRSRHPYVKVNCSALAESLLENELFGHARGAFTGADRLKIGRFEAAGKGTVFLDEIGDVSANFQKRLLRVLQEREYERIGETTPRKMEARVIAATNQNLYERVEAGLFRSDLYYRLKVVEIKMPPLRDRKEDIPLLVQHCLSRFNEEMGKSIAVVSDAVMRLLMAYDWPGNVRELKNILEHTAVVCKNETVTAADLPQDFFKRRWTATPSGADGRDDNDPLLEALEKAHWNKTKAARLMGISRRTLYRKLHRLETE